MAAIYGYEVKRLNEQVKRNINRFPDDFMFRLTKDELEFVKSQIVTSRDFSAEDDFNAEYAGLSIRDNNECHDRFIVIDYKSDWEKVYHCGVSSKDAGNKVCVINEFEETSLLYPVIDKMLSE